MYPFLSLLLYLFHIHTAFLSTWENSASSSSRNTDLRKSDFRLRNLHVLFRHGDRSPMCSHALSDQPFENLWPAGRGQLSDRGIIQEFQLGRWIRKNYFEFIPEEYNASEYHMRSTDIDRTLMSAEAFTAGLYERVLSPLEKYNISWRPIPVHTVKERRDILLSAPNCPLLERLQKAQMDSQKSLDFEQMHQPFFRSVNEHMLGLHFSRNNIWEVQDATVCMRAHNMTMSQWLSNTLLAELEEVSQFYWIQSYASTAEIVRLEIGVFLYTMLEHMSAVAEGRTPRPTESHHLSTQHMMAYSAHDTDVTYLLAAFGVYDEKVIEYSSAIVFELLEATDLSAFPDKYFFRLRYKRGWKDEASEYLSPKVCGNYTTKIGCPLNVLKREMQSMLLAPEKFEAACSVDAAPANYVVYSLSAVIVILGVVCIALSMVVARLYWRRKSFAFQRFDQEI